MTPVLISRRLRRWVVRSGGFHPDDSLPSLITGWLHALAVMAPAGVLILVFDSLWSLAPAIAYVVVYAVDLTVRMIRT